MGGDLNSQSSSQRRCPELLMPGKEEARCWVNTTVGCEMLIWGHLIKARNRRFDFSRSPFLVYTSRTSIMPPSGFIERKVLVQRLVYCRQHIVPSLGVCLPSLSTQETAGFVGLSFVRLQQSHQNLNSSIKYKHHRAGPPKVP